MALNEAETRERLIDPAPCSLAAGPRATSAVKRAPAPSCCWAMNPDGAADGPTTRSASSSTPARSPSPWR